MRSVGSEEQLASPDGKHHHYGWDAAADPASPAYSKKPLTVRLEERDCAISLDFSRSLDGRDDQTQKIPEAALPAEEATLPSARSSASSDDAGPPEEYIFRTPPQRQRREARARGQSCRDDPYVDLSSKNRAHLPGVTDGWSRSMASTCREQGCNWRQMGASQSAPMLPAVDSPHVRSMYVTTSTSWRPGGDLTRTTSSFHAGSSRSPTLYNRQWHPLGSTWRERSFYSDGEPTRSNVDDSSEFIHGCVPGWGKERIMRTAAAVGQRLTWTYYRMKDQHKNQPVDVLDSEAIPSQLRANPKFNFWADLRPPFSIQKMERDPDDDGTHPDGVLYTVGYSCGVDYESERLWGGGEAGTFESCCRGYAEIRIPKDFPGGKKSVHILSWGTPSLLFDQRVSQKLHGKQVEVKINPKEWSPLAAEIGCRPDHPRFKTVNETLRRMQKKIAAKEAGRHWQRTLLRPHNNLADFVEAAKVDANGEEAEPQSPKRKKKDKKRNFRMHTACAGFIRFDG